jgi:hypothetical protein
VKRTIALTLAVLIAGSPRAFAVGADKSAYVGGTISSYNAVSEPIEGRLEFGSAQISFLPDDRAPIAERLTIDYSSIQGLELGQRSERRLPLVTGAVVAFGPFGLPALKAKRRAHRLTLVYADGNGKNQVVVMALGKDVVRPALAVIEARSGIAVEYQDEEARKWNR